MVRFVAIATVALVCVGCGDQTLLRITVETAALPAPAGLRLTLVDGSGAPPTKMFATVTFPATLVVRGLPAETVCVQADGLDASGDVVASGTVTIAVLAHKTTNAAVTLAAGAAACAPPANDMGVPDDLAGVGGGGGTSGGGDMARAPGDMAVALCPTGSLFCDDFESGNFDLWSSTQIKYADMGSVSPSMTQHAHGSWSEHAQGSGLSGFDNYVELEKDFPAGVSPPLAVRANLWTAAPLTAYTMVIAFYDNTVNGFSLGGDNNATWVMTENQATGGAPDHHSTTATPGPGWHCVEIVIDGAGMVSAYVDSTQIIAPFARISSVAYTGFYFGIPRTVVGGVDVFVDDVAIGPSRLYCPP